MYRPRPPGSLTQDVSFLSREARGWAEHPTALSQSWEDPETTGKMQDREMTPAIRGPLVDFKASPFGPHNCILHPHVLVRDADKEKRNAQGHSAQQQLRKGL